MGIGDGAVRSLALRGRISDPPAPCCHGGFAFPPVGLGLVALGMAGGAVVDVSAILLLARDPVAQLPASDNPPATAGHFHGAPWSFVVWSSNGGSGEPDFLRSWRLGSFGNRRGLQRHSLFDGFADDFRRVGLHRENVHVEAGAFVLVRLSFGDHREFPAGDFNFRHR